VPVGGGLGKLVKSGKIPMDYKLTAYWNLEKPDFAPDWSLQFTIKLLFPKSSPWFMMKSLDRNTAKALVYLMILAGILLPGTAAMADWINLSGAQSAPNIAEIHIGDDHVRLVLEIYVNDIETFIDLLPEEWLKKAGTQPPPIQERMQRFSNDIFQVLADDKERLIAELKLVEPRMRLDRPNPFAGTINPYTGQRIPGPPEDKRVLYAELIYPFAQKPQTLTFLPPVDGTGTPRAAIGFITYHKAVPVIDYRYLSEGARISLDWDDPWYSRFEKKALQRWQLSGIRTFLYIEPYEVRHETLVRVKDMAAWMDLGLRGADFIEVDEFDPLKQRIGEFLLKNSNVRIDGKSLPPILDRTSFVKYTMTRTYFINQPERLPLNTAMVGVIVTYLTQGIPQNVTVDWDLFSDRIQKVPTNAVDPAGPFPSYVTPEDNLFTWTNFLKTYQMPTVAGVTVDDALARVKVPMGSIICVVLLVPVVWLLIKRRRESERIDALAILGVALIAGSILFHPFLKISIARPAVLAPEIGDEKAVLLLENLLKNVYRSFDFREEEDVYDRLVTSVSGNLLSDVYLQNRKSLIVTQAGGARARVNEINILDVAVSPSNERSLGLLFRAKWTAKGTVGHWGHIHTRKNQYEATITVEPVDGVWKITGLELLEEKRINPYGKQ